MNEQRQQQSSSDQSSHTIDWSDVVFEVDLLKSQEINLDYILELIFERHQKVEDKETLIKEIRHTIRSSIGHRAKEELMIEFIKQTDLATLTNKADVIAAFYEFAQLEQKREVDDLIVEENLNAESAKRYISTSLKREFASENGTELNDILPKMSPLNPRYLTLKQSVLQKVSALVDKFKGIGENSLK